MMDIPIEIILLCIISFLTGFLNAIVGGGGLLQTPAGLILLPQYPMATVLGARLVILNGNSFIRIFFLFIVCATILRFAYDVVS